MYSYKNIIPNNYQSMYKNNPQTLYNNDDRFFLTPFVVGGLAGTALGYGIANNNQLNNKNNYYLQPFYPMPIPYYPCCGNNYNNFFR